MVTPINDNRPTNPDLQVHWHALTQEEVLHHLDTKLQVGLTSAEVESRQKQFGLNQLQEAPRPGFLRMVFDQLKSFVVILLIVASVVSAVMGEFVEAAAIIAIVVLNAILGVIQESRAEQALAA